MSVIQFGCPFCGAVSEVDADRVGQETSCPACASVLVVPQAEPAAPDWQVFEAVDDPAAEGAATTKAGSRRNKPKLWQTSPCGWSGRRGIAAIARVATTSGGGSYVSGYEPPVRTGAAGKPRSRLNERVAIGS